MNLDIDKQYTDETITKFNKLYLLIREHPMFNGNKSNIDYWVRGLSIEITINMNNLKSPLRLITMYQYTASKIRLNYNIDSNRKLYECDVHLINTHVEALLELIKKVKR